MSARFARQISLAEIGTAGQAQIEATVVSSGQGDPRALAVALDYLERAGTRVDGDGVAIDVPGSDAIEALAGRPELTHAAAFLVGCLAATEHLARAVGIASRVAHVAPLSEPAP